MNKIILMYAAFICVATLAGCSTIKGIGEDISSLGGIISGGSDHIKESVGNNPPGSKMNK